MEVTDLKVLRQLRFYLRLCYPVCVTATGGHFVGRFPDLPSCVCVGDDLPALHGALEQARRDWIVRHVMAGERVPLPNSHTRKKIPAPAHERPQAARPRSSDAAPRAARGA